MGVLSKNVIAQHQDFYNWQLLVRQVRHSTATQHIQELIILRHYLKENPLTFENLVEFITFKRLSCKASYVNHYVDFAGVWSDYQKYLGNPVDERFYSLKYFKIEPTNKSTMSDEEIEAFLKLEPPCHTFKHFRTGRIVKVYNTKRNYAHWTLFFWLNLVFISLLLFVR